MINFDHRGITRTAHALADIGGSSYLRWVQGESAADEEHA